MADQTTPARVTLRITAYPQPGPYERWEVTREDAGEVILRGGFPVDHAKLRADLAAYQERQKANA